MNKKLIILEMANNHQGDYQHAINMIDEFKSITDKFQEFDFAWKFQFRDFESFIHKDFKTRTDLKYVKRFQETSLDITKFEKLKNYVENLGYKTICTGFDETSVDNIIKLNFNYIKVASCSFTDWPLLEKIASFKKEIILSTAGATVSQIDDVVSFFINREIQINLMHCVGIYPTKPKDLELNQIDFLKSRYPGINVGYSTHEEPDEYEAVIIAVGKKAEIFEKHVALNTEKYTPNAYSVTPLQMESWLNAAKKALKICGIENKRKKELESETRDLGQFKRGLFLKRDINKNELITSNDVYFSWPPVQNQLLANEYSKYLKIKALSDLRADNPLMKDEINLENLKSNIKQNVEIVRKFIEKKDVILPKTFDLELSHHYGLDQFKNYGLSMITLVNREYCKKILILLKGQKHPEQFHKIKEETFLILQGNLELKVDGKVYKLNSGDMHTIKPNQVHSFLSKEGCIIEEISTNHKSSDSYYLDDKINLSNNRKTIVKLWS